MAGIIAVGSAAPVSALAIVVPLRPGEGIPIPTPPEVTAGSFILYDETYDVVLASQDAGVPRPLASTTKMMTALVALEEGSLDRLITVSEAATLVGESEIGLVAGERVSLRSLVTAMLVRSANDAAVAIAEGVAGTVPAFVGRMNRKADDLGLDDDGQFSSAADLLAIARAGMEIPEFASMVATTRFVFPPAPDGTERFAETTNALLEEYEGAIGVKTGFTFDAGLVLVAAAERDGRRLYAVVMGSVGGRAHFDDAAALLDHGFDEYGLVSLVSAGETYGIYLEGDRSTELLATTDIEAVAPVGAAGALVPAVEVEEGEPVIVIADEEIPVEPIEDGELPGWLAALEWIDEYLAWFRDAA
jgi:serine-type D-Ala-D-Ala carboxypeptidase (penicillin-binding protein 5/6)